MSYDEYKHPEISLWYSEQEGFEKRTYGGDIGTFAKFITGKSRDGVFSTRMHLLYGIINLLNRENMMWKLIKKEKNQNKLYASNPKISASAIMRKQRNLQDCADLALIVIQRIAEDRNEELDEEELVKMVRGLIGWSITQFETENAQTRLIVELGKIIENLRDSSS